MQYRLYQAPVGDVADLKQRLFAVQCKAIDE